MADPLYVTSNSVTQAGNVDLTVTFPAAQIGDALILNVGHANDSAQYDAVTYGFPTTVFPTDISYDATPSRRLWLRGRVCDGTEPASVTVTVTNGSSASLHSAAIHVFRNTAGLSIEGSLAAFGFSSGPSDRSVTTTRPNRLACNFMLLQTDQNMGSWTGETGGDWTLVWQMPSGRGRLSLQTALLTSAGTIDGGGYTLPGAAAYTIRGLAFLPGANGVASGAGTATGAFVGAAAARGAGNGGATGTLSFVGRLLLAGAATGAAASSGVAVGSTVVVGVGAATGAATSTGAAVGEAAADGDATGAATYTGTFAAPPIEAAATGSATLSGSFDGRTNIPPYLEAAKRNSRTLGALFMGIMKGSMANRPLLGPGEPPPVVPAPGDATGTMILTGTAGGALRAEGVATGHARLRGNWDNHRRPAQNRIAVVIGIWR